MPHKLKLDVSSLVRAVNTLSEAVDESQKNPANLFVCDATIHRFEYTYELAHKMLKRYLELSEPNSEAVDLMSFPDLIQTASERGLVSHGWDVWKLYRDARNTTSHTYNEEKAIYVCTVIPSFLEETIQLLATLQQRLVIITQLHDPAGAIQSMHHINKISASPDQVADWIAKGRR